MLSTSAITKGSTCRNLCNLIGKPRDQFKVINLLWPDSSQGSWDEAEGEASARVFSDWMIRCGHFTDEWVEPPARHEVSAVLLLGRNVATAFGCGYLEFGTTVGFIRAPDPESTAVNGMMHCPARRLPHVRVPGMILPHPSGRSRVLNDPVQKFLIQNKLRRMLDAL